MYSSPKYNGEPTAQALASGLATLGRYGDDYMVHASEGETIIPGEIFEANPRLKRDLFRQMTMMGIEDPNRYVVGNSLNSLNPVTGQPEFFFKKIWKAAKKVFKKAAPILAPIVGNLIAPGIGGIIASALTTKLMGGSWGDALKAGALSYAGGALTQGIGGALSGTALGNVFGVAPGGTFMGGLTEGLSAPFGAASNLFSSGAQNPLAQGIFGPKGAGMIFSGLANTDFAKQGMDFLPQYQSAEALMTSGMSPVTGLPVSRATPGAYNMPTPQAGVGPTAGVVAGRPDATQIAATVPPKMKDALRVSGVMDEATFRNTMEVTGFDEGTGRPFEYTSRITGDTMGPEQYNATLAELKGTQLQPIGHREGQPLWKDDPRNIEPGWFEKRGVPPKDAIFGSKKAASDALGPGKKIELIHKGDPTKATSDIYRAVQPKIGEVIETVAPEVPWYKSKEVLGPAFSAFIPAALTLALTPDDNPEEEVKKLGSTDPRRIAYDKWVLLDNKNSPEALALRDTWYGKPRYSMADLQSKWGATQLGAPRGIAAARGGEVIGRGTGTSDSIPARLSDGEFVMTADAVRNAGNGDRNLGAARMYDMMSRFERMG